MTLIEVAMFGVFFAVLIGMFVKENYVDVKKAEQPLAPIVRFPKMRHRMGRGDVA